jgi:hypothetical protein
VATASAPASNALARSARPIQMRSSPASCTASKRTRLPDPIGERDHVKPCSDAKCNPAAASTPVGEQPGRASGRASKLAASEEVEARDGTSPTNATSSRAWWTDGPRPRRRAEVGSLSVLDLDVDGDPPDSDASASWSVGTEAGGTPTRPQPSLRPVSSRTRPRRRWCDRRPRRQIATAWPASAFPNVELHRARARHPPPHQCRERVLGRSGCASVGRESRVAP